MIVVIWWLLTEANAPVWVWALFIPVALIRELLAGVQLWERWRK